MVRVRVRVGVRARASESTTTSRGLGVELVHLKELAELAELADEVVATSWRSQRRGPTLAAPANPDLPPVANLTIL